MSLIPIHVALDLGTIGILIGLGIFAVFLVVVAIDRYQVRHPRLHAPSSR